MNPALPIALAASLLASAPAQAEPMLLMAEEDGCYWCARWSAEIGPIYPKTPEGRTAPLLRYDLQEGPPDGITVASRVSFTPTFILVNDGIEVARIEGYPGEDFFWGLLAQMLKDAQIALTDEKEGA